MYQPPHFREDDLGVQHALIRAHPLGLLITVGRCGPTANLLPFHLDRRCRRRARCRSIWRRANSQWREIEAGAPVLVVFQGADCLHHAVLVCDQAETGKVVPTWNYAMVQVRGRASVIHDADWLRTQIGALTGDHEAVARACLGRRRRAGRLHRRADQGDRRRRDRDREIDGKWKVSQNRPAADIARVAEALGDASEPHANAEMAGLVRKYGEGR